MSWNIEKARHILKIVTDKIPMEDNVFLIRFGTNAIFHAINEHIVIRISPPGINEDEEEKRYRCLQYLISQGIHCAETTAAYSPFAVEDSYVTFWHYIEPSVEKKDFRDFGILLKQLHDKGNNYSGDIGSYDMVDIVKNRLLYLENNDIASAEDLEFLSNRLERLSKNYAAYSSTLGIGVIHGDAHAGNIIRNDKGQYLCDFDYLSIGPREWDLIPTIMGNKRFKLSDEDYQAFTEGYGHDALTQENIMPLLHLRELSSMCWLYQNKGMSDKVDAEITRRLHSLKEDDETAKWKAH